MRKVWLRVGAGALILATASFLFLSWGPRGGPSSGSAVADETKATVEYEYKVVEFSLEAAKRNTYGDILNFKVGQDAEKGFTEQVAKLAKDRWEYVGLVHTAPIHQAVSYVLFRRAKQP